MAKVKNAFSDQGTLTGKASGLGQSLIENAVSAVSPFNNFGRYMTGSRAIIKVNGKLFGFAFGVNYNIHTAADDIATIDDWNVYEFAPSRIHIEGTLGMFHIPSKGPTREFVQANVLSFLFHKYITIEISDQTTGQTIFKTEKAWVTNKSQSLQAGELSTIQLSWKAIGWIDELTPFYPTGHEADSGGSGNAPKPAILDSIKKLF
jgi:hypothetical protein